MARQPIHLELVGGKGPRQRIWELIRRFGATPFELAEITPGGVDIGTTRTYVLSLVKAGILAVFSDTRSQPKRWRLANDCGVEAPRLRRDGTPVAQGGGNDAMWGAMQALGSFNAMVLTAVSGVKLETAKGYCLHLARAGYLGIVREGKGMGKSGMLTTYRLLKSRNTGPRAPMVTRLKAVYDPNEHRFAWQQAPDDVIAELEAKP